jgi:tetratricopeptide (TPR) repeat protein
LCANLIITSEFKNKTLSMSINRIELLQTYLKEEPDNAFTLYALALEYLKAERYNEAKDYLSTLVNKHSDYLPVYYQFGKLSEKLNEKEKANEMYLKGIDLAKKLKDQHTLNELRQAFNSLNEIDEDEE